MRFAPGDVDVDAVPAIRRIGCLRAAVAPLRRAADEPGAIRLLGGELTHEVVDVRHAGVVAALGQRRDARTLDADRAKSLLTSRLETTLPLS